MCRGYIFKSVDLMNDYQLIIDYPIAVYSNIITGIWLLSIHRLAFQ